MQSRFADLSLPLDLAAADHVSVAGDLPLGLALVRDHVPRHHEEEERTHRLNRKGSPVLAARPEVH